MKLKSTLISLIVGILFGWSGVSQAATYNKQEITLLEAIEKISKEYEVYFTFDMTLVADVKVEYEHASYGSAEEAIANILEESDLKYKFYDQRFVILYKVDAEGLESLKKMSRHLDGLISEGEKTVVSAPERRFRTVPKPSNRMLSRTIAPIAFSVEGTVTDQEGELLIGVNIQVKGSNKGTATDFEGRFLLEDIDENAVLVVSYIGYQTQEVVVAGKSNLNIAMVSDSQLLDEVVVVGYGAIKRRDLTGSVSSISGDDLETRPIVSAENALQGIVPGINIADRNSRPGELGTVSIRSIGSISAGYEPLWVIDGFPTDQRNAAAINPADIASIDILKDASSTAIYGSRGANGVIIITTKSPREGQSSFNINMTSGISNVPKSARPKMLNAEQYVQFYKEGNEGNIPSWISNTWDGVTDTDWRDELYQTTNFQKYSISASGGSKKVSYLLSGGYINQGGVIPGEKSGKYSARLKVDYNIRDRLKIGLNLAPNITQTNLSSANPQSPGNNFASIEGTSSFQLAENMPPILPVRRADGSFSQGDDIAGISYANPLELIENYKRTENLFRMLGGMELVYTLNDDLIFKSTISTNIGSDDVETVYNAPSDGKRRGGLPAESTLSLGQRQNNGWLNENTITFNKQIVKDHSIDLLAGFTIQNDKYKTLSSSVRGLPIKGVNVLSFGNSAFLNSNNGITEHSLISYLGRVNYSFKDRYLLTGTVRSDGSSRFGVNNRFKTFGSFALGWRVSEEKFLKDLTSVDNAKIRLSYGTTGSNSIPNFISRASLNPTQMSFGGIPAIGVAIGDPGNPDLTWETSTQLDVGLDLALFKYRVNLVFDYYNNTTSGLLLSKNVVSSSGFTGFLTNIGSVRNRGVEIVLNTHIIDNNDFKWTIGGNVAWNQQEILDLGSEGDIRNYFGAVRRVVGGELQNIHLVKAIGIFREGDIAPAQPNSVPGDIIYEDVDGDGVISNFLGPDGQNLDGTNLDWVYGLSTSVKYKNLELSTLFNGQTGASIFDQNLFFGEEMRWNIYKEKWYDGRYISESQPGDGSTPRVGGRLQQRTISTMIQNTDFFRFRNITLSYDLPRYFIEKVGISNAIMSLSIENVHTWTKFVGGNPDGRRASGGGPALTGGSRISGVSDNREIAVNGLAHLPLPRIFTLGINVSL